MYRMEFHKYIVEKHLSWYKYTSFARPAIHSHPGAVPVIMDVCMIEYAERTFDKSTASRAFSNWLVKIGIEIATNTAMMATTIKSSASVKPFFSRFMGFFPPFGLSGNRFSKFVLYSISSAFAPPVCPPVKPRQNGEKTPHQMVRRLPCAYLNMIKLCSTHFPGSVAVVSLESYPFPLYPLLRLFSYLQRFQSRFSKITRIGCILQIYISVIL